MVPKLPFFLTLLVDIALERHLALPLRLRPAVLDELFGLERRLLCARAGICLADVVLAQTFELAGRTRVVWMWEEGRQGGGGRGRGVGRGGAGEAAGFL